MRGWSVGRSVGRSAGRSAGAVSLWLTGDFYGFAHGSEASGVPGWGGVVAVGSVVVSRSRATSDRPSRPKAGREPPAALRGRLRGERPRRRGEGADTGPAAVAACGPGPDPSSHRRPEGNQPGLVVSSRITRCWGAVSFGWTPPARADWLRPPTRRGIRNLPSVGSGHRPHSTPARVAAAGFPCKESGSGWCQCRDARPAPDTPHGARFRIPRRVGGRSQAERAGAVKPNEAAPQQRVMRLDSTGPLCFR